MCWSVIALVQNPCFLCFFEDDKQPELWSDSRVSTLEFLTRRSIKHPIPEIYAASAALSGAVTLFADLADS